MRRRLLQLMLALAALGALVVLRAVIVYRSDQSIIRLCNKAAAGAHSLFESGKREQARAALEEALKAAPDQVIVRRELAMQLLAAGDLEEAARELRVVVEASPQDAEAACNLAAVLTLLGKPEAAVYWQRRAAQVEPQNGITQMMLAGLLLEVGDVAGALEAAEEAVKLARGVPQAHVKLGLARWRSGDLAGALEALQEAISLRPSDAPTMLFAAAVSDELGLFDEALKYARRAVEIAPENANAWAALGGALVKAEEPVRAREAFARALELDPGNEIARKALSRPDRGGN